MNFSTKHSYDAFAFFCNNTGLKPSGLGLEVVSAKRMDYKAKNDERESKCLNEYASILKFNSDNNGYFYTVKLLMKSVFGEELKPDFSDFPEKSWFLHFTFKLATPLICKDDETFYVHDNPFHKDKVFKVPFYPASSWKGRLRWMAYKQWIENGGKAEDRVALDLLFGDEIGEEEGKKLTAYLDECCLESKEDYHKLLQARFNSENNATTDNKEQKIPHHAGNLYFYPTFFYKLSQEVINPHDRKKKAGTKPIQIETISDGSEGKFSLLFVPAQMGVKKYADDDLYRDLRLMINALHDLLQIYGFGAKTSSGFGIVKPDINGRLQLKRETIAGWEFKSFDGLQGLADKVKDKMNFERRDDSYGS
jgi:CRISPR-associated protein Cmr2